MYKLLLCWRYLLTRYIALSSVISVMLGVATMIVVNAVMLGFTTEMKDRIQGILADVSFQSYDQNKGFPDYESRRDEIFKAAGDLIEELTPVAFTQGMLAYKAYGTGAQVTFPVDIVGIDVLTQGKVSRFATYLQHPENRERLSFNLHNGGYDTQSSGRNGAMRDQMRYAGWEYRKYRAAQSRFQQRPFNPPQNTDDTADGPCDPFAGLPQRDDMVFDPAKEQNAGIIVGIGAALRHRANAVDPDTGKKIVEDDLMLLPGDDVTLVFPTASEMIRFQSDLFTVVDLYESKMAEYDRKLVFVPIETLQRLRGMVDVDSETFTVTRILIKAKPGVKLEELRDRLRETFSVQMFVITTWKDDQEDMLNAIYIELMMLNVLLFLIFAVAGFGIFAIFYMIVIEKQKDIGILKALGASSGGVLQIFCLYSLVLGIVGSTLGLIVGLLFVKYIKEIAVVLSFILQREIFSPEIYSFYEIPTVVDIPTVIGIIVGAIFIAASAGVLPAMRAARVHPVETLRS